MNLTWEIKASFFNELHIEHNLLHNVWMGVKWAGLVSLTLTNYKADHTCPSHMDFITNLLSES